MTGWLAHFDEQDILLPTGRHYPPVVGVLVLRFGKPQFFSAIFSRLGRGNANNQPYDNTLPAYPATLCLTYGPHYR